MPLAQSNNKKRFTDKALMGKILKMAWDDGAIGGWISFVIMIFLMIFGFFSPPQGVIDSSILLASSELLGFAVLFKLPNMIKSIRDGRSLHIHHNNTDVEVTSEKDCDCQNDNNEDKQI